LCVGWDPIVCIRLAGRLPGGRASLAVTARDNRARGAGFARCVPQVNSQNDLLPVCFP
jgi:hypothetical protein